MILAGGIERIDVRNLLPPSDDITSFSPSIDIVAGNVLRVCFHVLCCKVVIFITSCFQCAEMAILVKLLKNIQFTRVGLRVSHAIRHGRPMQVSIQPPSLGNPK